MKEIKNIVIADYQACSADAKGGTEIASYRIAEILKKNAYTVFNLYWHGPQPGIISPYEKVKKIDAGEGFVGEVSEFLKENRIDAMIFMGSLKWIPRIRKAITLCGQSVKLFLMLHYVPGREIMEFRRSLLADMIRLKPSKIDNYINFIICPVLRWSKKRWLSGRYRRAMDTSDGIILLSEGYPSLFQKIAGIRRPDMFTAIPNLYSINNEKIPADIAKKEKRVLLLSRLDEKQKRISHIIRIWKQIEDNPLCHDWVLDIVGSGRYLESYRKLAEKLGLSRIFFHSWQDSAPYLERASLFVMTSLYEGLSLSLIEAMSHGCVPVVYGSYPAAYDVIDNGRNGFIIDGFGNMGEFAQKLTLLMGDMHLRCKMAHEAETSVEEKFNAQRIGKIWSDFLSQKNEGM